MHIHVHLLSYIMAGRYALWFPDTYRYRVSQSGPLVQVNCSVHELVNHIETYNIEYAYTSIF